MQIWQRLIIFVAMAMLQPVAAVSGQTVAPGREAAIIDSSAEVLGQILSIPGRDIPESLLNRAEGVVIVPGMIKGGFIVGIRHGRGVMMTRDDRGDWRPPQFVEITGGSIGWQLGIQGIDLVLVFCTRNSLQGLHRGKLTIGANASAAAGPVGREAQAATDGRLSAEIYSYSRTRGLFAGVSLDGAALSIDSAATSAYYQMEHRDADLWPASANRLREQLARYTRAGKSVPAAGPVAANSTPIGEQELRRELAASSQQLTAILDPAGTVNATWTKNKSFLTYSFAISVPDVYAVAAVGYYLLTGSPVFTGRSVTEICMKHTTATPDPPSTRIGRRISPDFENLILQCLSKSPEDRPRNASALYGCLDACHVEGTWTTRDAAEWWGVYDDHIGTSQEGLAVTAAPSLLKRQSNVDTTVAFDGDTKETNGGQPEKDVP